MTHSPPPSISKQDETRSRSGWVIILSLRRLVDRLSTFDRIIIAVMALLIAGVILLALVGNTTGVRVLQRSPAGTAAPQTEIRLKFDTSMSKRSVEDRFSVQPEVEGAFQWLSSREVAFKPDEPLIPGQRYRVVLKAGARSSNGDLTLQDDLRFEFRVSWPRIVYLGPYSSPVRNLQLLDLETGQVEPLTGQPNGIIDYAVSADGTWVAFTAPQTAAASDIWALNLNTRELLQLTNCAGGGATCYDPAWGPGNQVVAYTREELDPALDPINTKRAWVVPLDTRESRLLLDDPGAKASAPEWSPVGERVAVVLGEPPGILVYDFPTDQGVFIQTAQGVAGIFSPDGKRFIYPKLAFGAAGATYYTHLGMVDLEAVGEQREVELSGGAESPVDDLQAAFHPDGTHLAIVRRYLDNRYTEGGQVYWLDATTLEATPLVVDPAHTHGAISFSQDGRLLLMQRYNLTARRDPPEIWLYVLPTHEMRQVVVDGFLPKFLP